MIHLLVNDDLKNRATDFHLKMGARTARPPFAVWQTALRIFLYMLA
jgi:hypothetical protein